MENNNDFLGGEPGGMDPRADEASRFEQRLENGASFYMEISTLEELYEYYRLAQETAKARQLLDYAVIQYPEHADFYYKKSCLLYESGEYTEAYRLIQRALELNEEEVGFIIHKSLILSSLDELEEALKVLQQGIVVAPESAELHYHLGAIFQSKECYVQAIDYYTKSLKLNNGYEDLLFEIIYCYEASNQSDKGIEYCLHHIDQFPYSTTAWHNLGMLYQRQGLHEKALSAYEYAIVIQEEFVAAHHGKAEIQLEQAKFDEAIRTFLTILMYDNSDISALLGLGECYESLENYSLARSYYQKATKVYENLADGWYGIGSTYESEANYFEAVYYYQKALQLNADHYDSWLGLAECEFSLGNEVSSYQALHSALELNSEEVEVWREWALRFKENGDLERALSLLQEGIQNLQAVELLYQYAAFAYDAGRKRDAIMHLENALILDFEKHAIIYEYCPQLLEQKNIQDIIKQYKAE